MLGVRAINSLRLGGLASGGYAAASLVGGWRPSKGNQRQSGFFGNAISDGSIAQALSIASRGGIPKQLSDQFQRTIGIHDLSATTLESVRLFYRGVCNDDRQRNDERRLQYAQSRGYCTATMTAEQCHSHIGAVFMQHTGIVPRPDAFVPTGGGERVAAIPRSELISAVTKMRDIRKNKTTSPTHGKRRLTFCRINFGNFNGYRCIIQPNAADAYTVIIPGVKRAPTPFATLTKAQIRDAIAKKQYTVTGGANI